MRFYKPFFLILTVLSASMVQAEDPYYTRKEIKEIKDFLEQNVKNLHNATNEFLAKVYAEVDNYTKMTDEDRKKYDMEKFFKLTDPIDSAGGMREYVKDDSGVLSHKHIDRLPTKYQREKFEEIPLFVRFNTMILKSIPAQLPREIEYETFRKNLYWIGNSLYSVSYEEKTKFYLNLKLERKDLKKIFVRRLMLDWRTMDAIDVDGSEKQRIYLDK